MLSDSRVKSSCIVDSNSSCVVYIDSISVDGIDNNCIVGIIRGWIVVVFVDSGWHINHLKMAYTLVP